MATFKFLTLLVVTAKKRGESEGWCVCSRASAREDCLAAEFSVALGSVICYETLDCFFERGHAVRRCLLGQACLCQAWGYPYGLRKGTCYLFGCIRRDTDVCILEIARVAARHKVVDRT